MPLDDGALRARLWPEPVGWQATQQRLAAVLVPLVTTATGDDVLVFCVRPQHLRQHPGQIGFPGGMREGDETVRQCALREYGEELGVADAATNTEILGALPLRSSSTGILVHPLVARTRPPLPLRPCAREVERVLLVPFAELRDESRWEVKQPPPIAGHLSPPSPHFAVGSDVIWGLTGRLCWDLIVALRGL